MGFCTLCDSLPRGPEWTCEIFEITGDRKDENGQPIVEEVELWKRDPVECMRELIGNPAFRDGMRYAPERHYEDEQLGNRVYGEMVVGDWWWKVQASAGIQIFYIYITALTFSESGETSCRCNGLAGRYILRQNKSLLVCWGQTRVASIHHHWEYRQEHSP